jgi:hypothetical protein
MPSVFANQFVIDHHHLIYMHGKEDGYAFSINTVTGKLESACILPPKEIAEICDYWGNQGNLQETRQVTVKVTPLRALPYRLSWNTAEMLPNAARAMWHRRNTLDKPIKCVSAWVEGGIVVKYAPNDGMSDPMTHHVFAAGYGGVWLPMKYNHSCPVHYALYPSVRKAELEQAEANLSD